MSFMSIPSAAVIEERVRLKVYDDIGAQIVAMERAALAEAAYNRDYRRHMEKWSSNYMYRDNKGDDFRTLIVGEIQGYGAGTILCAKGNHYPGGKNTPFRPVTDESKVKDVLVLGLPTSASSLMEGIFENQLAELNTVLETEDKLDAELGKDRACKEWVKSAEPGAKKDLIVVHMLPKYGKPAGYAGMPPARCVTKRSLTTAESGEEKSEPPQPPQDPMAVCEGAFYDPHLNVDFGGPYFQLARNKLIQLDVRDEENELVAPWLFRAALRPGTVVLLNCSLHCFILGDKNTEKKIYQINAHSVRILAHSDVDVPKPVQPQVPKNDGDSHTRGNSGMKKGSVAKKAIEAFNAFSTKRRDAASSSQPASEETTTRPITLPATSKPKRFKGAGSAKPTGSKATDGKAVNAKGSGAMEVDTE